MQHEVFLAESYSIRIVGGDLKLLMWAVPRASNPADLHPPDCVTFPPWFLLLALAVPTAFCGWRAARRGPALRTGTVRRIGHGATDGNWETKKEHEERKKHSGLRPRPDGSARSGRRRRLTRFRG